MTPYEIARGELGVAEVAGAGNNPRILDYAHEAGFDTYTHDSEPWCALFMAWCLHSAGHPHTRSLAARSYEGYGKKLAEPYKGCIIVLSRTDDPQLGHVGFYDHEEGEMVYVLGGNQGDKVSVAAFSVSRVLAYREPSQTTRISRKTLTTVATSAGAAVSAAATNPDVVVNAVSVIPAPPEAVTRSVSNLTNWQSIGDTLWSLTNSLTARPLVSAGLALLLIAVWFWPARRGSA